MSSTGKTKQLLVQALVTIGNKQLADLWGCSIAEASKKVSGTSNINIDDIAKALAEVNVQLIVDPDMRVIHVDELQALNLLGKRYLDRRVNNVESEQS